MLRRFLLVFLCAAAANAQRLSESIEVRVVNVDVVVTDRNGNAVHGLSRDDFDLLEDRVPQKITNFYEVSEAAPKTAETAAPAEARLHRRFAFFIDSDSLLPAARTGVLVSLRNFVETSFRPGDEASVINFRRAPKLIAPLMSDRAAVLKALDAVAAEASPLSTKDDRTRVQQECTRMLQRALDRRMNMRAAYDDCINEAGLVTAETARESKRLLAALRVILATLDSGAEAKKVLVVAGARLPARPGAELYSWANQLFMPYLRGFNRPTEMSIEAPQTPLVEEVARLANDDGVTIYLLHDLHTPNSMSIQNGLPVGDNGLNSAGISNTLQSFETLAEMTGGTVTSRMTFDGAFTAIARDLGSYYSLGYKPADSAARQRALVVHAKNRDYTVRARQSYAPKTADEQMSDRVVANVFSAASAGELPVRIRTGAPQRDGANFRVPVEVTFPSTITLLPEGERLSGGFTVYIVAGNESGALSDVSRRPQPVSLTKAEAAEFRAEPVRFTMSLTVRPGENWLSIGVVDQVGGGTGLARATIVAK